MRILCVFFSAPAPTTEQIQAFAESAYRVSPDLALRGTEALFVDLRRLATKNSNEGSAARLQVLLNKFSLSAQIGQGNSPTTALWNSRNESARPEEHPLIDLIDVLDPFAENPEAKRETTLIASALGQLGLRSLEDFGRLPSDAVSNRFSKAGLLCWQRLKDSEGAAAPWPYFKAAERLIESDLFLDDELCGNLEALLFKLRVPIERLCARLRGRGRRLSKLQVELSLDRHSRVKQATRHWELAFLVPQGSASGLLLLLRERLARDLDQTPLESEVKAFTLEVLESAPACSAQKNFFDRHDEERENLNSLINRMAEKLGTAQVFQTESTQRYLPELSWQKTPITLASEGAGAQALPYGPRPLRLFSPPRSLRRQKRQLRGGGCQWEISSVEGPEKINGEWWDKIESRRYFRVKTLDGSLLWIFSNERGEIFLHGIFE